MPQNLVAGTKIWSLRLVPHHSDDGGRGQGRARGTVAQRECPQDPLILWSTNFIPCAEKLFGEPSPGPTQRYQMTGEKEHFLSAMFTDDIWNLNATETNRYYDQQASAEPHKNKVKCTPVSREGDEGFCWNYYLYMGMVKLPRIKMYWSNDTFLHQETVRSVMSQTRLLQIW